MALDDSGSSDGTGSSDDSSDSSGEVIVLSDSDDDEAMDLHAVMHNAAATATATATAAVSFSTPARTSQKRKAAANVFPLSDRAQQQLESLDPSLQTQFLIEFPQGVAEKQSQEDTKKMTAWLKKNAGAS
jgi:hypothetical protein